MSKTYASQILLKPFNRKTEKPEIDIPNEIIKEKIGVSKNKINKIDDAIKAFESYCKELKLVGLGWPEVVYENELFDVRRIKECLEGKIIKGWYKSALLAFGVSNNWKERPAYFITRIHGNEYYIGMIKGNPRYFTIKDLEKRMEDCCISDDEEQEFVKNIFKRFDNKEWLRMPWCVSTSEWLRIPETKIHPWFIPTAQQSTVKALSDDKYQRIIDLTWEYVFDSNEMADSSVAKRKNLDKIELPYKDANQSFDPRRVHEFATALSADHLEDLVAAYIIAKKEKEKPGWRYDVRPSSCKQSTPKYEFYIDGYEFSKDGASKDYKNGELITCQVKNQSDIPWENCYTKDLKTENNIDGFDEIYLFSGCWDNGKLEKCDEKEGEKSAWNSYKKYWEENADNENGEAEWPSKKLIPIDSNELFDFLITDDRVDYMRTHLREIYYKLPDVAEWERIKHSSST